MKCLQGHLLVASPHLPDPNFFRTVVLLIQHQEQGALGLVLNRPSTTSVREVIANVSDVQCDTEETVGVGGPIEGPLMALHRLRSCSETEVLPGIYFAAQRDHVLQIVQSKEPLFRMFSGYAGWGEGQLENELKVGGWLTMPGTSDYVFGTATSQLWKKVTRDIGHGIIQRALKLKNLPQDPRLN